MEESEKTKGPDSEVSVPPQSTAVPRVHDESQPADPPLDVTWVDTFYRECGREVTLAYTTLNQMKNWAMTVAAAALSALAFGNGSSNYPNKYMFVGVVIVYVFVLRFYVRAILCYINLVRWNTLQYDCVEFRLLPRVKNNQPPQTKLGLESQFREHVQNYYFAWLSPIDRKTQLISNLKLGFGLIFSLIIFFFLWGLINLWHERLVKGLFVFAVGTTITELNDFMKSRFFDTVDAYKQRRTRSKVSEIFPVPASGEWYLALLILVILLSVAVAEWPTIVQSIHSFVGRLF
jgi:hypothetical protein